VYLLPLVRLQVYPFQKLLEQVMQESQRQLLHR
jgi:hypothetical protein